MLSAGELDAEEESLRPDHGDGTLCVRMITKKESDGNDRRETSNCDVSSPGPGRSADAGGGDCRCSKRSHLGTSRIFRCHYEKC